MPTTTGRQWTYTGRWMYTGRRRHIAGYLQPNGVAVSLCGKVALDAALLSTDPERGAKPCAQCQAKEA